MKMKTVLRIGTFAHDDMVDRLIQCEKKYPGCFNTVWLNSAYGYPSMSTHKKTAKELAQMAKKFRNAGISVALQLSNTIGHGEYMSTRDCSGLVGENSPARKLVGHNGATSNYAFCWNDRFFRDYISEQVEVYVKEIQPDEIWIDDDLRATNHAPVDFGCFCDECLSDFNRKFGYTFQREELVEEFLHGSLEVREKYISYIREGLESFTEEICRAAVKYSPDIVISLQNCANGPYTGYGYKHFFAPMYHVTGHRPNYRPGGGAYSDHNPNEIVKKCFFLEHQWTRLPEYVDGIYPEIENTPDTAMGKTMYGTAFEATLYLAAGATDISFAMLGGMPESLEYYESGF